tara:strand:- start:3865 stop:5355 length:1491 start_codon:yes stop_codon:yes gene_type:complete
MAIGSMTFPQEPVSTGDKTPVITNWTPIVPYTVHVDDISGLFYFKIILSIYLGASASGQLIGKLKQRRNGYTVDISADKATAIFDMRDIVNSQLEDTIADAKEPTKSIHLLGKNNEDYIFSENNNQIRQVYVKGTVEYSSSAEDSPQEYASPNFDDTRFYIAASLPLEDGRGTDNFQTDSFENYTSSSSDEFMLTDTAKQRSIVSLSGSRQYVNYLRSDDYHTIGFLNDKTNFGSECKYFEIVYYEADGSKIGEKMYIENALSTGGADPSDDTASGIDNKNARRLLYFGCGPKNLEEAEDVPAKEESGSPSDGAARPSNFSGYAYYSIRGSKAADDDTGYTTTPYYFVLEDGSCKGYKVRRLGWRNSKGCYDYFNFKRKSIQTLEVARNEYETMLGNFSSDMYSYDNFDRGKRTRQTTAVLKETINTDWLNEDQVSLMESLLMSTNVNIIQNADTTFTVPVMITDKSIIRKTSANDKLKIQYTFKIEYANPYNTNS